MQDFHCHNTVKCSEILWVFREMLVVTAYKDNINSNQLWIVNFNKKNRNSSETELTYTFCFSIFYEVGWNTNFVKISVLWSKQISFESCSFITCSGSLLFHILHSCRGSVVLGHDEIERACIISLKIDASKKQVCPFFPLSLLLLKVQINYPFLIFRPKCDGVIPIRDDLKNVKYKIIRFDFVKRPPEMVWPVFIGNRGTARCIRGTGLGFRRRIRLSFYRRQRLWCQTKYILIFMAQLILYKG